MLLLIVIFIQVTSCSYTSSKYCLGCRASDLQSLKMNDPNYTKSFYNRLRVSNLLIASHLIYPTRVDWMRFDSNQLFKNKIKGAEGFEFLLVWLNPLNLVKYRVFRWEQQFYLKYSICRQATISITRMLRKAQLVILSLTSCFSSKWTKKQIEIPYTAV